MITIFKLTENLQKFIDMQVTEMARTNPMIGFTKPLITRAAHNAVGKAHKAISLLADKDGNIDIENILSEMTDSLMSTQPFTINTSFIGDIVIGNGTIRMNIPFTGKDLVFNSSDIQNLRDLLTNRG